MANAYYSKQWTGLATGTVVAVKGGTAVIGTDAFSTYATAKAAGDVVLCDVFVSNEWAGTVASTVDVVISGDTYTLNVGEEAFATLEAAALQVATNQYGGVETYGDNEGVSTYGYVSGAWSDLPDYTVVTTGSTVWDEDGAVVTGGTAVIGVTAFATYAAANNKFDTYYQESKFSAFAASSDVYLDSTWTTATVVAGNSVSVTLADNSTVTAIYGQNAVILDNTSKTTIRASVMAAANTAKASGGALYFTGGTFLAPGTNYPNDYFYTYSAKTVVTNTYFNVWSGGNPSDYSGSVADPDIYILKGGRVGRILIAGRKSTDNVNLYIGTNGYAGSVEPAYAGNYKFVNVMVDGGTFGSILGANLSGAAITQEYNVTVDNNGTGTTLYVGTNSGVFAQLCSDVNFTVKGGSFVNTVTISERSVESMAWYRTYNVAVQDFTVTIDDATVKNITNNGNCYWSFESYNIVLDGGTITGALNPAGTYSTGTLAYNGGTATITGGTFVTSFDPGKTIAAGGITFGDENIETVWSGGVYRYLSSVAMGTTTTKNADGSVTVVNGVFYNKDAASGKQWIQGGTATFANGSQNQFTISVTGDQESYIEAFASMESIVVDATAQLTTTSGIVAGRSITIDATDFEFATGVDEKLVISAAGGITTSDITIVSGGSVTSDYLLKIDGGNLYIAKLNVAYSAAWEHLETGTKVVVSGNTFTIGEDAFGNYATAQSEATKLGRKVANFDKYYSSEWSGKTGTVYVVLDGETVGLTMGTDAFGDKTAARAAAVTAAALVITGSTQTLNGRNMWNTPATTIMKKSAFVKGSAELNGALITLFDGGMTIPGYDATFTVGEDSYLHSLGATGNDSNPTSVNSITYNVIDGGSASTVYIIGYSNTLTATVNINVNNGGVVSGIYTSYTGGTINGNVNIAVTGGTVLTLSLAPSVNGTPAITDGHDVNITLENALVSTLSTSKLTKGEGSTFNITVNGDSTTTVGDWSCAAIDTLTIDANATLVNTSYFSNYKNTITVDAANCDYTKDSYLVLSAGSTFTNDYVVINDDPVKGAKYELFKDGNKLYYQKKTGYFSTGWAGLEEGTIVTTPNGTATIGTNAFATYDEVVAADLTPFSADVYFNYDWASKSTGDVVTVSIPGGTFTTKVSQAASQSYIAFTDLTYAQNSYRSGYDNQNAVYITGGTTTGAASNRIALSRKKTVITNTSIIKQELLGASTGALTGGTTCIVIGTGSTVTSVYAGGRGKFTGAGQVFILDNAYVSSVNGAGTSCDGAGSALISVDGGTTLARVSTIYGGGTGSFDGTVTIKVRNARGTSIYGGAQQNANKDTGDVSISLEGSTYTTIKASAANGHLTAGTVSINLTNSIVDTVTFDGNTAWKSVIGERYLTVNGGSIRVIEGFAAQSGTLDANISNHRGARIIAVLAGGTATGDVNIALSSSTLSTYAALTVGAGTIQGNATFSITDSNISQGIIITQAAGSITGTTTVNLAGSTVSGFTCNGTITGGFAVNVTDDSFLSSGHSSMTALTIAADATLTISGSIGYAGTITIDAADCDYTQDQYLIVSAGNTISNNITVINDDPTLGANYEIYNSGTKVYYQKKKVVYSAAWENLADETKVVTLYGTYTIGTDAFSNYATAKQEAATQDRALTICDKYYSTAWAGETGTVYVVLDGETVALAMGTDAFDDLATARTAAVDAAALVITGSTQTLNGRNMWNTPATTIMKKSAFVKGSAELNGALITLFDGGMTIPGYDATFTVGEDSYLHSLGATGNDSNPTSVNSITYNAVDGGRIGVVYMIGYGGSLTAAVDINVANGGRIDELYSAYTGSTLNGVTNISVTDGGTIGLLYLAPATSGTSTINGNINITLDSSTINTLSSGDASHKADKGSGVSFNVKVTGTAASTVADWYGSSIDSLTIDATATLNLSDRFAYSGTITVDAQNCDYSQSRYLIVSAASAFDNSVTVINDDATKGYELVKEGSKLYYQKSAYFSAGWAGLEAETIVTTPGGTAKIGTNAFATYDEAVASGLAPRSADVYFNYDWANKSTGAEVTVSTPGGSFTTQVSSAASQSYLAFTSLEAAQSAYRTGYDNQNTVYITGGSTSGNRVWLNSKRTVITGTTFNLTSGLVGAYESTKVASGGTTCMIVGTGSTVSKIIAGSRADFNGDSQVFIRDNADIGAIYGGGFDCFCSGTMLIDVDGGTTKAHVGSIHGGGYGTSYTGDLTVKVKNAYGSTICGGAMNSNNVFTGDIDISLEGSTYSTIEAGGQNGILVAGTVSVNLKDSDVTNKLTLDGEPGYVSNISVDKRYLNIDGGTINLISAFKSAGGSLDMTLANAQFLQSVTGKDSSNTVFDRMSIEMTGSTGTSIYGISGGTATGNVDVAVTGSTLSEYLAAVVNTAVVDGNVTVDVTNSYIGKDFFITQAASTINGNVTVNLAGGTINAGIVCNGIVKGDFAVNVTDDSFLASGAAKMTALTIDYDATLTLTGALNYAGTITVDAEGCDYSQSQYLIIAGAAPIANTITVDNDDPTKNYEIVKSGNNVYYQEKPVYFSKLWTGLSVGTEVSAAGKTLTIGTDAFATYTQAQASGRTYVYSADTYLNDTYNATDPIVIDDYTAKYGEDAFSDKASAVSTAVAMAGGELRVTGWTSSGINGLDGVADIELANVNIGSGASINIQANTATTVDHLNLTAQDVDCNGFLVVAAGTVTNDVNIMISNVTTHGSTAAAFYGVNKGVVGGNLSITVSGNTYIANGIYTQEGTVNGNVDVTLAGGTFGKRGVHIRGTVGGTTSLVATGDVIVSTISGYDTVTVNAGASITYGKDDFSGSWEPKYLVALPNLVNNGTFNYDAEIGQNAYKTVAYSVSGNAITSTVGNVISTIGGTTYAAEIQSNIMIDSSLTGKTFGETVNVNGTDFIYGVSAFNNAGDAKSSAWYDADTTTLLVVGGTVTVETHGNDEGKLGFSGSTVTAQAYAGKTHSLDATVTTDNELKILAGTAKGVFDSLFAGEKVTGATTTVNGDSSLIIAGDGEVTAKAVIGGSYVGVKGGSTAAAINVNGSSNVTISTGRYSSYVVGGSLVNSGTTLTGGTSGTQKTTSLNITGGYYGKSVAGGNLSQGGAIDTYCASDVTISGGTIAGYVFGGNMATKLSYTQQAQFNLNSNTSITLDASVNKIAIIKNGNQYAGNVVAGSYGMGSVSGNTTITVKGLGSNLTIEGNVTGDSSGASEGASSMSCVTGIRSLVFDNFSGSFGANSTKIIGFDALSVTGGSVNLNGYGQLANVSDWSITDGTLDWSKGSNSFSNDKLTLAYSQELGDNVWTAFKLTEGLTTYWDSFAKVQLSINGESGELSWSSTAKMYTGTINEVDYKFYNEDNSLKVAKLA